MLRDISDGERTLALLELTRRLVLFSSPETYIKKLEKEHDNKSNSQEKVYVPKPDNNESQQDRPKKKTLDKNELKNMDKETSPSSSTEKRPPQQIKQRRPQNQGQNGQLKVPEPKLPPQFSHLKPDNKNIDLDLGKLNPLIQDSNVREIECHGPNEKITVKGGMGEKPTNIQLSQEEIDEIVNTFSDKAGIPVEEGTTQMVLGKFQMNVIKPEGQGNKRFTIKKSPPKKQANVIPKGPQQMPQGGGQGKNPGDLMPPK